MNHLSPFHRRSFIKKLSAGGLSLLGLPQIISAFNIHPVHRNKEIFEDDRIVILFQGDSITDAHRRKDHYYANDMLGMGLGYVHQVVSRLLGKYPERKLGCYNRGISGNKVFQLANRWEDDCIQLRPDILSILIGVNDFWHSLSHNYKGTVEIYEKDLRSLLDRTKESLPDVRLIIGEPFIVEGGSALSEQWYPDFHEYRKAAYRIAKDYKAVFIPYHSVFEKALEIAPASYWCPDGVHPSMAGGYLMANAWLEAFDRME
ncbi:MAG: SGNH/GDSL hydrolase family protein [Bacteroidetes bacterium]|nr:SGNH/GDSL hydrolase family protein [Bacteroidota bacterium]